MIDALIFLTVADLRIFVLTGSFDLAIFSNGVKKFFFRVPPSATLPSSFMENEISDRSPLSHERNAAQKFCTICSRGFTPPPSDDPDDPSLFFLQPIKVAAMANVTPSANSFLIFVSSPRERLRGPARLSTRTDERASDATEGPQRQNDSISRTRRQPSSLVPTDRKANLGPLAEATENGQFCSCMQ